MKFLLLLLIAATLVSCTRDETPANIVNELPDIGLDTEVFFIEEGVLDGYAVYITYNSPTEPCVKSSGLLTGMQYSLVTRVLAPSSTDEIPVENWVYIDDTGAIIKTPNCHAYYVSVYLNGVNVFNRTNSYSTAQTTDQLWDIATESALENHLQREGLKLTLNDYSLEIVTYPSPENYVYNAYYSASPFSRSRIRYHISIQSGLTLEEAGMMILQDLVNNN